MKKKLMLTVVSVFALAAIAVPVSAQQETCPEGNGWVKVDGLSGLSYTYPVPAGYEVTDNCYKASNTVVFGQGPTVTSAVFNSPQGVTCTAPGVPHNGCALQDLSHASFKLVKIDQPDFCDPSTFNGSVGRVVPPEVRCVEPSVNAVCGALEGGVTNLTPFGYGISWSVGSPDYNFNTSLPASFPEDYNGGSVEVFYWVVGAEADYVTGRGIPNFWEQNAASVTVDTNCNEEDDGTPFGFPDTNPLTSSQKSANDEAQVEAPKSGVKAGFGSLSSVLSAAAVFISSLGSLAYGFFRFGKFGL